MKSYCCYCSKLSEAVCKQVSSLLEGLEVEEWEADVRLVSEEGGQALQKC